MLPGQYEIQDPNAFKLRPPNANRIKTIKNACALNIVVFLKMVSKLGRFRAGNQSDLDFKVQKIPLYIRKIPKK